MSSEKMEPAVSRVKQDTQCELVLLEACRKAILSNRPFTIKHGYDNEKIGAFTEVAIWYEVTGEDEK